VWYRSRVHDLDRFQQLEIMKSERAYNDKLRDENLINHFVDTHCTHSHLIRPCIRAFHYRIIPFQYIHHYRMKAFLPDR
jgi:hypothetical protein